MPGRVITNVRTGEDVDLAELDCLGVVDVPRRAQNEEGVAVALERGTLVSMHRVFDGERMQIELVRERSELLLVRPIEPNPGDAGTASTGRVELRKPCQAQPFAPTLAVRSARSTIMQPPEP